MGCLRHLGHGQVSAGWEENMQDGDGNRQAPSTTPKICILTPPKYMESEVQTFELVLYPTRGVLAFVLDITCNSPISASIHMISAEGMRQECVDATLMRKNFLSPALFSLLRYGSPDIETAEVKYEPDEDSR